ncbi:hypothetical protein CN934_23545 [Ensifer sp. MMN_5]|nr:hypothetical protein [Sinorhizobium meliloti]PND19263.1 hypothetical protein CN934_23545 [Ensifer sp. MMN_5]RVQ02461.1 hypothetical protein CN070_08755 [Sinorhizobium meliloti]
MMHTDGCSIGIRASFPASCKSTSPLAKGAQMSCDTLEYTERKPLLSLNGAMRLAASALRRVRGRSARLDLESTSDYMKRDLGFMDGREPRPDDEILR